MIRLLLSAGALLLCSACAHQVIFDRPAAYSIATPKLSSAVTAVVDEQTLTKKVSVRAFMSGIANTWEVEPGDMLKQVADIELPQMFSGYEFVTADKPPVPKGNGIALQLSIADYQFNHFAAHITVEAVATGPGQQPLLQKTYSADGESHGAKMYWAGPFGMKSVIRQSSLDAYKKIFSALRADLLGALQRESLASRVPTDR